MDVTEHDKVMRLEKELEQLKAQVGILEMHLIDMAAKLIEVVNAIGVKQ